MRISVSMRVYNMHVYAMPIYVCMLVCAVYVYMFICMYTHKNMSKTSKFLIIAVSNGLLPKF